MSSTGLLGNHLIKAAVGLVAVAAGTAYVLFVQPPAPAPAAAPSGTATTPEVAAAHAATVAARSRTAPPAGVVEFGVHEPKPRTPGTFRLATYNVENLFDDADDPALDDRYENDPGTKPDAHCRAAAEVIRRVDADVWAFQEVESEAAIRWFLDRYVKDPTLKYITSIDAGDRRGIEQSVVSRFPITAAKNHPGITLEGVHPAEAAGRSIPQAGQPLVLHRSPLKVSITVPAGTGGAVRDYGMTLFVVHHKAGREYDYWRQAEAAIVLSWVQDLERESPGRNIVILGDFNARTDEPSFRTYTNAGLLDVFGDVPRGEPQWQTHASNRIIDHILVNKAMRGEVVTDSRFVLGTPVRPRGSDWNTTPAPEGYASDHFPVVVDIRPIDAAD
ncbi:MAG: endonuclease/exonuclease/phosphatase family protein [Phycisphaeraceae bacterium]|nr:MAG: endonuclease/exonuclease/phosphatase family protein [Phycisphaeraceae bacterium]